jgi:hypothetical protein
MMRFKSKIEFAKDCETLKQVQEMQCTLAEQNILSAIDYHLLRADRT